MTAADFPLSLTTSHQTQITIHGVDVYDPTTGEIRSHSTGDIACWFIDTDYDGESFFVTRISPEPSSRMTSSNAP